jgi:hypothetical protein
VVGNGREMPRLVLVFEVVMSQVATEGNLQSKKKSLVFPAVIK